MSYKGLERYIEGSNYLKFNKIKKSFMIFLTFNDKLHGQVIDNR